MTINKFELSRAGMLNYWYYDDREEGKVGTGRDQWKNHGFKASEINVWIVIQLSSLSNGAVSKNIVLVEYLMDAPGMNSQLQIFRRLYQQFDLKFPLSFRVVGNFYLTGTFRGYVGETRLNKAVVCGAGIKFLSDDLFRLCAEAFEICFRLPE